MQFFTFKLNSAHQCVSIDLYTTYGLMKNKKQKISKNIKKSTMRKTESKTTLNVKN